MKSTKLLALLLTLAILLVSVPFGGMATLAADDDAAKIEAIKTAWSNLEEYLTEVTPNGSNYASNNVAAEYLPSTDTSVLPENAKTLPTEIGSAYVKATVGTTETATTDDSLGSSWLKYGLTNLDITNCNVYLSFYIEEVNGTLSILPYYRKNGGAGNGTGNEYFITAEDTGKWVTLSGSEIAKEVLGTTVTDISNNIILAINSSADNVIYFGSFIITKKYSVPEETDNWNLAQWVAAAKEVDTEGLYNVEAFELAIADAETDPEIQQILAIRDAWKGMGKKVKVIESNSSSISNHGGLTDYEKITASNAASDEYAEILAGLDSQYVGETFERAVIPASTSNSKFIRYSNLTDVDILGANVYFSFYVNGELSEGETITLHPYYREGASNIDYGSDEYTKPYTITASQTGKWVTLDGNDITPNGEMVVGSIGNYLILYVTAPKEVEIIFGNFIFTQPVEIPEESVSWDLLDWICGAKAVDTTGYYEVEAFNQAIATASQVESVKDIVAIRDKWATMQEKVLEITPASGGAAVSGLSVSNSENLAKEVGSKYVTVTTGAATGNTVASLGSSGNYIKYDASSFDVSKCDVIFSFYIEELKGEMSLVPYFRYSGAGANTGKEYVITQEDVGKWVTLTTEGLVSDTYSQVVTSLTNAIILGINSTEQNTVKFGSFIFTENATPPEESADWSLTEWKKNAKDLDVSDYFATEEFTAFVETLEIPYEDVINAYEEVNGVLFERQPHRLTSTVDGVNTTTGVFSLTDEVEFDDINKVFLGYEYATYTYGAADAEALLFENGQEVALERIDNVYLYYRVDTDNREDKTQDITVTPTVHWTTGHNTTLDAFTLSSEKVGEWVKLTDEDIFGEGGIASIYNSAYNGETPLYRITFNITNASGATITFGSMMFEGKMTVPAGYDEFAEADWLYNAYRVFNKATYNNTDALKTAIAPLEANVDFGDATGDGKTDIVDLIRMKKDISASKYIVAEDLDKNAYVNGSDLTVMKKFIIGAITEF